MKNFRAQAVTTENDTYFLTIDAPNLLAATNQLITMTKNNGLVFSHPDFSGVNIWINIRDVKRITITEVE
jgi:hypothetical protein